MKRGTPDHPKTKALAVRLNLCRWQVVGLLESLWHFSAGYAKRGDIGKWSNAEIAAALEWKGEADALIAALVDTHWLDESKEFRLLVHHWQDHADQTVKRSDEVLKLGFASCQLANASQPNQRLPNVYPSHSHSHSLAAPAPSPSANGETLAPDVDAADADAIWGGIRKRANCLVACLGGHRPAENLRRKIAASLYLESRGEFPAHWVDEAISATKKATADDPWKYLWGCLRNSSSELEKDLPKLVAKIRLPKGF